MANTHDHAYSERSLLPRWYLMAVNDKDKKFVQFVFLDGGKGIPNTIKKKYLEILRRKLGAATHLKTIEDSALILSALKGEFRTRTEKSYRGKGLPKIIGCAENKEITDLVIISNFGVINTATGIVRDTRRKLFGTLFSWRYTREATENENHINR
jgi:hypothetical protein